ASIPPRSAAVVALAASLAAALPPAAELLCAALPLEVFELVLPAPELLLDEHAVALRARTAAVAAMPVRRRFTGFLPVGGGRDSAAQSLPRQGLCGCQVDGNSASDEQIEVVWPTPSCMANYEARRARNSA